MSDTVRNSRDGLRVGPASGASVGRASVGNAAVERGTRRAGLLGRAWQVPLLSAGIVGVAAAVWYARTHPPLHDFDGALAQASDLIGQGEFGVAEHVLWSLVAPNLDRAPDGVRARFEATAADFLAARIRGIPRPAPEDDLRVVEAYEAARAAAGR